MRALVLYDLGTSEAGRIATAVAGGLPNGFRARTLCVDDATGADLDGADLIVLGGCARRMGPSRRLRAFLARTDRAAWRHRHVAVFETTADRHAWPAGRVPRMTAAWLRGYRVARPIPCASFLLAAPGGELDDAEPVRAASWGLSLPIAAHMPDWVDGSARRGGRQFDRTSGSGPGRSTDGQADPAAVSGAADRA